GGASARRDRDGGGARTLASHQLLRGEYRRRGRAVGGRRTSGGRGGLAGWAAGPGRRPPPTGRRPHPAHPGRRRPRRAPVAPGGHGPDDGPDQAGGGAGGGPPLRGARHAGAGGRPGRRLVRELPGRRSVGLTAVSRTRVVCAVASILLAACSTTGGSDTVTLTAVGGARPIVLSSS